jgi:hypothetical protein
MVVMIRSFREQGKEKVRLCMKNDYPELPMCARIAFDFGAGLFRD